MKYYKRLVTRGEHANKKENWCGSRENIPAEGNIAVTRERLEMARGYLFGLMDMRIKIAQALSEQQIKAIGPGITAERANRINTKNLGDALKSADKQHKEVWKDVPGSIKVPTEVPMKFYAQLIRETPRAKLDNIPAIATKFLGKGKKAYGSSETIKEMQGLRSKLLEVARIAKADKKFDKARIANDLADSVLEGMGAARNAVKGEPGARLRLALDFTNDMKRRFSEGPVGILLGRTKEGGARVPASLTLEKTGLRGPIGREEFDALRRATRPEGREPGLQEAAEQYLLNQFNNQALSGGRIVEKDAASFLQKYSEVLTRLPGLKTRFEEAIASQNPSGLRDPSTSKLLDPDLSVTALFLGKEPGGEIARVIASRDPAKAAKELVKVLKKRDPTGEASAGLKKAYIDYVLGGSEAKGTLDINLKPFMEGSKMIRILTDKATVKVGRAVLDSGQRFRLRTYARTALAVEQSRKVVADPEGIINDAPNRLIELVTALLAARVGTGIAKGMGGGDVQSPGRAVGFAQKLLDKLTSTPSRRMIMDSILNKELFESLRRPLDTIAARAAVRISLDAWAMGVIQQSGREISDDEAGLE